MNKRNSQGLSKRVQRTTRTSDNTPIASTRQNFPIHGMDYFSSVIEDYQ